MLVSQANRRSMQPSQNRMRWCVFYVTKSRPHFGMLLQFSVRGGFREITTHHTATPGLENPGSRTAGVFHVALIDRPNNLREMSGGVRQANISGEHEHWRTLFVFVRRGLLRRTKRTNTNTPLKGCSFCSLVRLDLERRIWGEKGRSCPTKRGGLSAVAL
jgi:hypothetical protein